MDFKQLEVFTAVVEKRSFSKAAEALYLTQPTISAHIKKLEEELNASLFVRSTKSLTVTPQGLRFYPYAAEMLAIRKKAMEEMGERGEGTLLRVGASSVPASYILPEALAAFQKGYPGIRYEVVRGDSMGVIEGLLAGLLDVGLVGTAGGDKRLHFQPFAEDELVLAAPNTPRYRQMRNTNTDAAELLKEPMLLREATSGTRREMENALRRMGVPPEKLRVAATMNDSETLKRSVSKGLGVAMLSRREAEEMERKGEGLLFAFGGQKNLRTLYIAMPANRRKEPALRAFLHCVSHAGR